MEINEIFQKELQLKVEAEKIKEETNVKNLLTIIKVENNITDEQLFEALNLSKSTFYRRLKNKDWTIQEMYRIKNIKFFRDEFGFLTYKI